MLANRTLTEDQTQIRRAFVDFFESDRFEDKYFRRVQAMMDQGKSRLLMDLNDLLDFPAPQLGGLLGSGSAPTSESAAGGTGDGSQQRSLGNGIVRQPGVFIPLLELAVHDLVVRHQPEYLKIDYRTRAVHVGFEGPFAKVLGPRELYARHLNSLVALEGVITRQSALRPRVIETVHYCPETNKYTKKEYRDQLTPMLDSSHLPTVNVMPKTDMDGNVLRTELGLSTFVDSQVAMLQEAPEKAPTGQLPRSVELRFDDDLVDVAKPGDRVMLVGTYMPYTTADSKSFQAIVLVNHVVSLTARLFRPVDSQVDDLRSFCAKCIASDGVSGVLKVLSRAIAPGIFGMTMVKQAILLQLVGGVERKAHNSHIRGDINILLVGEPSTAKSQLLRFVLGVSPLALNTTGKGSSGVGLTAAVTSDPYTGERSLSAGAMVLADRGVLCIDEFDKMSAQDRVSMHEAMEQQTVTIAKAGIHASLNARCSVLAAANPVYGFYSVRHKLAFNVGLPESLLSRFDLTFILLDQHSSEHTRRVGRHILKNHTNSEIAVFDALSAKTVVSDPQDEGSANASAGDLRMCLSTAGESIVSAPFLRRYIQYAKQLSPLLTEGSQQLVSQHYVQLRTEQEEGGKDGFFVTARTLEAILRLSTAHAKLRLSNVVEEDDVRTAMELLRASVHAATTATAQRTEDQDSVSAPPAAPGAKRAREEEAAEGTTPRPAPLPSASATTTAKDLVRQGLTALRREGRTMLHLHELRERVGIEVPVTTLQDALTSMQGEDFLFESTTTEDIITFL